MYSFSCHPNWGPLYPLQTMSWEEIEGASSWTGTRDWTLRWHWPSPLVLLGYISRGNINAAREAAVITCPFFHPACPDHWAIELVSLRVGEYLFMQSSTFSKGLTRQKHPIKYNSMVIKHLPRDGGSQTARKPELLPPCPLTRDIVFSKRAPPPALQCFV